MIALFGAESVPLQGASLQGASLQGVPPHSSDLELQARTFLETCAGRLGLPAGTTDLQLKRIDHDVIGDHVRFQQVAGPYPVIGAMVSVHLQDGRAYLVNSHYRPVRVGASLPLLSASEALDRAAGRAGIAGPIAADGPAEEVVWASGSGALRAWRVPVRDRRGLPYEIIVDAAKGTIIRSRPRFHTSAAPVYAVDPTSTPVRELRELTGLDDSGWLAGPFADVRLHGSVKLRGIAGDRLQKGADGFHFIPGDGRSAQVNAFYQINRIHDYYQARGVVGLDLPLPVLLGFSDGTGEPFTNAFFEPTLGKHGVLAIGQGPDGEDFSLDASVLDHEYTHFIVHTINPDLDDAQSLEATAINEALADYGAASVTGNPGIGRFIAPLVAGRATLRDLTSRRHYPEDTGTNDARDPRGRYVGFVDDHDLGEVISGALWDLRNLVGAAQADSLFLAAVSLMDGSTSFPEVRIAWLEADARIDAGADSAAIERVFDARGIDGKSARYLSPDVFSSTTQFTLVWIGPMVPDPTTGEITVQPMELCSTFATGRTYHLSGMVSDAGATSAGLQITDLQGRAQPALGQIQDVSRQVTPDPLGGDPGRSFDFALTFPSELAGQTVSLALTFHIGRSTTWTASAWAHITADPGPAARVADEPARAPVRLLGDADGDGRITVADVRRTLRSAIGIDSPDLAGILLLDTAPHHADGTTGDDAVTLKDVSEVLRQMEAGQYANP